MIGVDWLTRMNPRERRLAYAVAGILFVLVNLFIWNALLGMSATARAEYADRRNERAAQQAYLSEEKMWQSRADWLKKNQPSSNNPAEASSLLTRVKDIAGRYNVQVENPQIGPTENTSSHQSVSATFETKSAWEPLVHFLYDAQRPEAFYVFENVSLMVDANDPTVMQGRFKIAKWFSPGGRK
jgi:Type II secretion system (T2SS), protein M subtype b